MAVVKVIEILAQSPKGWEDAAQTGLNEVTKTVQDVQSIYVRDLQAIVENGRITQYRLNMKVSFIVRDQQRQK
ncbi:MAG TPA: dodecin domain-containing protein [Verrucomicrobia bacterium]|nr:dodecin domain-containing protein [Verrucomicrobiota bacterium]HOP97991.1 dodecin family protein [Verrucomicrobiota bacterium]HPU55933.1 dodecin family protein [Verrucomicrobiota bacterium]